jgi:hypothetical protein
VVSLLEIAQAEEPNFYPLLAFLLYTGCRKGEARAHKNGRMWTGTRRVS